MKRCTKCKKPLLNHNKTMLCSYHYMIRRTMESRVKLERDIYFKCKKCSHVVYLDKLTKLYKLNKIDCPECGEEGNGNWIFIEAKIK